MVQWLVLHDFTAEGMGSVAGQGSRTPQAMRYGQKKKSHLEGENGTGGQ